MVNLGFGAGGIVQGFQAGRGIQQQQQALDMQQQNAQFNQRQQVRTQVLQQTEKIINTFSQIDKNLEAQGIGRDSPEYQQAVQAVQSNIADLGRFGAESGALSETDLQSIAALWQGVISSPTSAQSARAEGELAAAQEVSRTNAIAQALSRDPQDVAAASGLVPEDRVRTRTFNVDGKLETIANPTAADIKSITDRGGFEVSSVSVQSPDVSGLSGAADLSPNEMRDIRTSIEGARTIMEELESFTDALAVTPESAGLLGGAISAGGILQQGLFGRLIGQRLLDMVGAEPQKVAAVRAQARTLNETLVQGINTNKRITNDDKKRAGEISRTLNPESSLETILSVNDQLMGIVRRTMMRDIERIVFSRGLDVGTPEGVQETGEFLLRSGFTEAVAADITAEIIRRRGQ
jgi:hypothetical protein